MAKQKEKGKGTRKYGRNADKCSRYRLREQQGRTAKTRRIVKALLNGVSQPGWALTEDRKRPFRK